jgi:hypothetical protein
MSKSAKETADIYKDAYENGPPGLISEVFTILVPKDPEEEAIRKDAYIDRIRDGKE